VAPVATSVVVGEILTETVRIIVTVAVLYLVGSATDVTVTVMLAGLGTVAGAV
jgi:hypothetical protein